MGHLVDDLHRETVHGDRGGLGARDRLTRGWWQSLRQIDFLRKNYAVAVDVVAAAAVVVGATVSAVDELAEVEVVSSGGVSALEESGGAV